MSQGHEPSTSRCRPTVQQSPQHAGSTFMHLIFCRRPCPSCTASDRHRDWSVGSTAAAGLVVLVDLDDSASVRCSRGPSRLLPKSAHKDPSLRFRRLSNFIRRTKRTVQGPVDRTTSVCRTTDVMPPYWGYGGYDYSCKPPRPESPPTARGGWECNLVFG